jgi:hypothetical protein
MKRTATICAALVAAACTQQPETSPADQEANAAVAANAIAEAQSNAPASVAEDDRTPLSEPNGPIDPKSAEGAGQVVQSYGALIEQRRFPEAEKLWNDESEARRFSDSIGPNDENHLQIGRPGELEGAAGSIYLTMPVAFYGKDKAGNDYRRPAEIVLRRINDVDGSTAEQRRWHITRIDWKG